MFVDFVRECVEDIENLPVETYNYCDSDNYQACPFYIKKKQTKDTCENIDKCHFFNNFDMESYQDFKEIIKTYCLSQNHTQCHRYKTKAAGKPVPNQLAPDGTEYKIKVKPL